MIKVQIMPGIFFSLEEKTPGRICLIRWWYVKCYFGCGASITGEFLSSSTDVIGDIHQTLKTRSWKERISDRVWGCPECAKQNRFCKKMTPKVRKQMEGRQKNGWTAMVYGSGQLLPAATVGLPSRRVK
jgi:hypothetical protein